DGDHAAQTRQRNQGPVLPHPLSATEVGLPRAAASGRLRPLVQGSTIPVRPAVRAVKGSMVDLPFADTDVAAKAGRYVIYVLAVFGGFLVGNVLTLILCRLLAKAMFRRRMPAQVERGPPVLCGIVVAALVAFLLFRMGPGWGLGGSGTGEGEGSGGPSNQSQQKQSETGPDSRAKEKPAFLATGLEITILRGRDYPKSYLFEAERA